MKPFKKEVEIRDWQGKKLENWMNIYEVTYYALTYLPEIQEFRKIKKIEIAINDEGSLDDLIEERNIEHAEIRVYPAKTWRSGQL